MPTSNAQRSTLNIERAASLNVEGWMLNIGLFSKRLAVAAIASSIAISSLAQNTPAPADQPRDLTVLILGDSLGLCGFSKRLDQKFRADPRVKSVFTYCTCGTNPLSWLKEKPFTHIQTHCGYWSIESKSDSHGIKEQRDTYGEPSGHRPTSHTVPKLDDLLATIQPDILVMQTGSNLFGLFSGREKVKPDRDGPMLRKYLVPFVKKAITPPSKLRKIYWIAPPISGRVSGEVQEFVFEQTQKGIGSVTDVIDSRKLISYPYKHMEPDKEHFIGEDMNRWADKVWGEIDRDLSAQSWSDVRPLSESIAKLAPVAAPSATPAAASLVVKAKLVSKTNTDSEGGINAISGISGRICLRCGRSDCGRVWRETNPGDAPGLHRPAAAITREISNRQDLRTSVAPVRRLDLEYNKIEGRFRPDRAGTLHSRPG